MKKKTYKTLVYKPCEDCGTDVNTMWCFWDGKWRCTDCAIKSFMKRLATLGVIAGVIAALLFMF